MHVVCSALSPAVSLTHDIHLSRHILPSRESLYLRECAQVFWSPQSKSAVCFCSTSKSLDPNEPTVTGDVWVTPL